jgi:hypothetical protein
MAAARDQLGPSPRFQTEWRKFDLLVQTGELATIIEFKYYLQRRTLGLQGEPLGFKGGPGPRNEAEFKACVHKLRTAVPQGVTDRRLILVYETQWVRFCLRDFWILVRLLGRIGAGSGWCGCVGVLAGGGTSSRRRSLRW